MRIQVKFANQKNLPFLAFGGAHGAITTLGKMSNGIEIYLNQLSSVEIAEDGQTATFGGGIMAKNVTDSLWAAGKQTGKSTVPQYHFMPLYKAGMLTAGDSDRDLRMCQPSWACTWRWSRLASGTPRTRCRSIRVHECRSS